MSRLWFGSCACALLVSGLLGGGCEPFSYDFDFAADALYEPLENVDRTASNVAAVEFRNKIEASTPEQAVPLYQQLEAQAVSEDVADRHFAATVFSLFGTSFGYESYLAKNYPTDETGPARTALIERLVQHFPAMRRIARTLLADPYLEIRFKVALMLAKTLVNGYAPDPDVARVLEDGIALPPGDQRNDDGSPVYPMNAKSLYIDQQAAVNGTNESPIARVADAKTVEFLDTQRRHPDSAIAEALVGKTLDRGADAPVVIVGVIVRAAQLAGVELPPAAEAPEWSPPKVSRSARATAIPGPTPGEIAEKVGPGFLPPTGSGNPPPAPPGIGEGAPEGDGRGGQAASQMTSTSLWSLCAVLLGAARRRRRVSVVTR